MSWKMIHQINDKYAVYSEKCKWIGDAERAGARWVVSVYGNIKICVDFGDALQKIDDLVLIEDVLNES